MDNEFETSESSDGVNSMYRTLKKRLKTGKERDVLKKIRATTHELEPDCKCKHFRCFENIFEDRKRIIRKFYKRTH